MCIELLFKKLFLINSFTCLEGWSLCFQVVNHLKRALPCPILFKYLIIYMEYIAVYSLTSFFLHQCFETRNPLVTFRQKAKKAIIFIGKKTWISRSFLVSQSFLCCTVVNNLKDHFKNGDKLNFAIFGFQVNCSNWVLDWHFLLNKCGNISWNCLITWFLYNQSFMI